MTQLHGVESILRILLNVQDREDIVEPSICTLRHLTSSTHPYATLAQVAISNNYGVPVVINFLQPQVKWPIIKVSPVLCECACDVHVMCM